MCEQLENGWNGFDVLLYDDKLNLSDVQSLVSLQSNCICSIFNELCCSQLLQMSSGNSTFDKAIES